MKNGIVLIGGGSHCKAVIDVIEAQRKFNIIGILDIKDKIGLKVLGYKIFATDKDIPILARRYKNFLVTIGQIKNSRKRIELFSVLKNLKAGLPLIVSPDASVSRHSKIGDGTVILHGARINAGVIVGQNCIINTNAIIEHDSIIGDHCHISTGCVVNGECNIGGKSFLGSGSIISNNVRICQRVTVGAGSVLLSSVAQKGTYAGKPAWRIG